MAVIILFSSAILFSINRSIVLIHKMYQQRGLKIACFVQPTITNAKNNIFFQQILTFEKQEEPKHLALLYMTYIINVCNNFLY